MAEEKKRYKTFKERYHEKEGFKDEFIKKYNKRVVCECGCDIWTFQKSKHLKTQKHKYMLLARKLNAFTESIKV